jgi:hypothetical protein
MAWQRLAFWLAIGVIAAASSLAFLVALAISMPKPPEE